MPVLATITIGQSPRPDLVGEMRPHLADDVRIIEYGALDGLSKEEIALMAPKENDYVLVTRLRDHTSVKIAESHILPLMQRRIDSAVDAGADVVALVCTGEFPRFRCKKPLIEPQRVLWHVAKAVGYGTKLGVVVPDRAQVSEAQKRWADAAKGVAVVAFSPYDDDAERIGHVAEQLRESGVTLGVLDCIGYTLEHKRRFSRSLGAPVLLARTALSRVLGEILG